MLVFDSEDKIMHDPLLIRYFISTSPKEAQLTHAGKPLDSVDYFVIRKKHKVAVLHLYNFRPMWLPQLL